VTLAITGVAVLGAIGVQALKRRSTSGRRASARGTSATLPEVERSLTVEKSSDELYRLWSDPQNFSRIIRHLAKVEMIDERRARWSAPPPFGQWSMRLVDNRPNEFMRWEPEDSSAPLRESAVRFVPARGKPGTVVHMRMLLNPPQSLFGQAAARIMHNVIPGEIASKTLHYFKSLALTGEIPTTERQPAAIMACRKGGTFAVLGVYGVIDKFPMGVIMNKGLTMRTAQQHGQGYMDRLLGHAAKGELDPSFLATHRMSLEESPKGYAMFKHKQDGCVRAVFSP
jgi:uncharacterized membrane protein